MENNKLKEARESMGLSRAQAALLLGVHKMSVYWWETGKKFPSRDNLINIYKVFGVTPNEMAGVKIKQK